MQLADYLPLFADKKVVVVGDLYLDEYIIGKPSRISREAPIAVLEFREQHSVPGGATAPACNISALGGRAYQLGVVGHDQGGRQLSEMLLARGVDVTGLVVDPARPTTTKTRIVARGELVYPQHVARIDRVDRSPLSEPVEQAVITYLRWVVPQVDAILFSDYKCGVVSEAVIAAALEAAHTAGKLIMVDSQGDLNKFKGTTLVKCNQQEAEHFLRRPLRSEEDYATALQFLKEDLAVTSVIITRGGEGMSILDLNGDYYHAPATTRSEVFDVTGAGDTVIAVLTLALLAGAPILDAAHLANCAAQVVVRKYGNATIQLDELQKELEKI
ncbi:MAG: bifunctional hydroxymethylpyrimidine kinase/phosphomethylpyrimidine kinase [Chloroflexi bacterium]|nr:bifunctional hydroxymethylpyrimidine kinase/phosphomethylpyrimidine kinase [Chloroflexota bacterium]